MPTYSFKNNLTNFNRINTVKIDYTDDDGVNRAGFLDKIGPGSIMYLTDTTDNDTWIYSITTNTDQTTFYQFIVTFL